MKLKISDNNAMPEIDLGILLKTRLLIQANSGGGKSYLLRRLAEQMFGKVQVIIIDPEGEFSTLREKFDYVLVGKGGETPADCRSAALVAHKLLELHASAVCDLYEMKPQERHRWVRLFLDAMIDAPKNLWHSVVVIVDEAHVFCPETKAGESEASGAMIDLATRGRKRGYCAIFATQRLGKLKKDAAAELTNVMIGQTFIDIDRDRAADCLGVSGKDRHPFDQEIKTIEQGNFFALGRAICLDKTKIKVGPVLTTHPEIGGKKFSAEPPPPSEKVKLMMPKLADLPQAAEEKAKTEAELKRALAEAKKEISVCRLDIQKLKTASPVCQKDIQKVPALTDAERKRLTALIDSYEHLSTVCARIEGMAEEIKRDAFANRAEVTFFKVLLEGKLTALPQRAGVQTRLTAKPVPVISRTAPTPHAEPNGELDNGQQKILDTVAMLKVRGLTPSRDKIARWHATSNRDGIHPTGGTYGQNLAKLRLEGYLDGCELTSKGVGAARNIETGLEAAKRTVDPSQERIIEQLQDGQVHSRDTLAAALGLHPTGGTYGQNLARLRTMGLLPERGTITLTEAAFL